MNIFVTNKCPVISAQEQCNVHNNKMVVESAQLLSTAHFVLDGAIVGYKPTHQNHPSNVWCRSTSGNYQWLYAHFQALCAEYTSRTGKPHKSAQLFDVLSTPPRNIRQAELETFAMAMPDDYKRLGIFDQTKAYQSYLNDKFAEWSCREKPIKVEWKNRSKPDWVVIAL
jgi:hypothetical protein